MRIASLIPSGTDIAVALGLADDVVGVSHECDNPAVVGRPVLTSAHVAAAPLAPPGEVDKAVVDAVTAGEPLYATDMPLLASLDPALVLAQDVCDVCAVPGRQVRDDLPESASLVTLSATSLSGLEDDLLRLGGLVQRHDEAVALIERLRAIRTEVMGRIGGRRRRRVLTLEWGDPPFVGGHWVPELVGTAGGDHLLVEPGDPSVRSTWEQVAAAEPEVVVFMPCGYRLDAAVEEGSRLVGRLPGAEWWAVDATSLYSRCTPAAVSSGLHVLGAILHSDACPPPPPGTAQRLA
ncbi:MAG TPA: ABC transporter substrate-binding protein [Acidimicrobiales bacterium]|nr:ABC transporter substrate-binding protein [Acidimicrobiales bacterium]